MNHTTAGFDTLKCDSTVLQNSRDGRNVILLLNFNLPRATVEEREEDLPLRLTQIQQFWEKHFQSQEVYYQMSASYWLQHRTNGDLKRWVGSFFARESRAASLTGNTFLKFSPSTFVQQGLDSLLPHNVEQSLTVNFLDSSWHFVGLISVIVNSQILVPVNHPFILQHGFLQQTSQRRNRRHRTFFPFSNVVPLAQQETTKEGGENPAPRVDSPAGPSSIAEWPSRAGVQLASEI
jgi:hypothetical protein